MKQRIVRLAAAFLLVIALCPAGLSALAAPSMNGPVNDLAGLMNSGEKTELTNYLTAVNDQTGVQVAVLTVPSLEGDSIEAFSMRVADAWKLGQADKDNGALLVIALNDRALRIEVGYGLEGNLTDMKSGLIIRNVIAPFFKEGKYGQGIIAGVQNIVGVATDNASIVAQSVQNPEANKSEAKGSGFTGLFFIIIFILMMLFGRGNRSGLGGLFWGLLFGSMLSGSGRSGRYGGGSGGGFSGGGGSFGGGGSSGGW